jgi:hypothetical protein
MRKASINIKIRRPKMKNKIIELIDELEDAVEVYDCHKLNQLKAKIQDMEFPLTLEEVKDCCNKNNKLCPLKKGMFKCQISEDPRDWDIEEITKAVRHEH